MAAEKNARVLGEGKTKGIGDLTVKIDVDVSDALTGLKAVERQAKKATQALKETESTAQRLSAHLDDNGAEYYADIRQATTKALAEELARREGVETYVVEPLNQLIIQIQRSK